MCLSKAGQLDYKPAGLFMSGLQLVCNIYIYMHTVLDDIYMGLCVFCVHMHNYALHKFVSHYPHVCSEHNITTVQYVCCVCIRYSVMSTVCPIHVDIILCSIEIKFTEPVIYGGG